MLKTQPITSSHPIYYTGKGAHNSNFASNVKMGSYGSAAYGKKDFKIIRTHVSVINRNAIAVKVNNVPIFLETHLVRKIHLD